MSYADLLKDPRWQRKRLQVLERAEWACEECSNDAETLHVHHTHYVKGRKPWEYPDDELRCLCATCHERITGIIAELYRVVGSMNSNELLAVLGFARAARSLDGSESSTFSMESFEVARGVADFFRLPVADVAALAGDGATTSYWAMMDRRAELGL